MTFVLSHSTWAENSETREHICYDQYFSRFRPKREKIAPKPYGGHLSATPGRGSLVPETTHHDAEIHKAHMDDLVLGLDSSEEVEVQLPRFKMEEKVNLKETLKNMGLVDVFDLNTEADPAQRFGGGKP